MQVTVESGDPSGIRADLVAIALPQQDAKKQRPSGRLAALDRAWGGVVARALRSGDFRGREGQTAVLYPDGRDTPERALLVGVGPAEGLSAESLRRAAGRTVQAAAARSARRVALVAPTLRGLKAPDAVRAMAEGAVLADYRFDAYKRRSENGPVSVRRIALVLERVGDLRAARRRAQEAAVVAECQNVARRLSNEPPNRLPPAALAREAQKVAREVGLRCRVFDVAELRRRKMGALLAVGGGSTHPPRLVVLEHNAPRGRSGRTRRPTVCVVGKGITFDSGGLSIKPAMGMPDMKHDMSGGAAVVGILRAAALLKLPLHVVGVVPAAENLLGSKAYRPSDIVRSASGRTIEILNTDAEGRVVLADGLHFATSEYQPEAVVDLATLTGACIVALGSHASGLMGNDDALVERLRKAGELSGERVWPLPLFEEHRKAMKSEVADLRNTGGRDAGASTAAAFLQAFVGDVPWAHLDIAGTANSDSAGPYHPKGATGVGVRLVTEMLRSWSEGGRRAV